MKKLLSLKILLFILIFISTGASAGGWQSWTKVKVLLYEGGPGGERAYVTFEVRVNPDKCTNNSSLVHQRIYGDSKRGEYIISTLLMAMASDKEVLPLLSGCDDWNRPVVTGLRIRS